jgi:hypothetical protein
VAATFLGQVKLGLLATSRTERLAVTNHSALRSLTAIPPPSLPPSLLRLCAPEGLLPSPSLRCCHCPCISSFSLPLPTAGAAAQSSSLAAAVEPISASLLVGTCSLVDLCSELLNQALPVRLHVETAVRPPPGPRPRLGGSLVEEERSPWFGGEMVCRGLMCAGARDASVLQTRGLAEGWCCHPLCRPRPPDPPH